MLRSGLSADGATVPPPFGPHPPSGRSVELPYACVFPYANGALAGERFFFDLAAFCDGIGLPIAAAQETLAALRAAEETA